MKDQTIYDTLKADVLLITKSNLYKLREDLKAEEENLKDGDITVQYLELERTVMDLAAKLADNHWRLMKNAETRIATINARMESLEALLSQNKKAKDFHQEQTGDIMFNNGVEKIESIEFKIGLKKRTAITVLRENVPVPKDKKYCVYHPPVTTRAQWKPNKPLIKKAIQSGEVLDFAFIKERGYSAVDK